MRDAAKNCGKISINTFGGGVQGRSKSSMLTYLKSLSAVLVMINNKSVPICNRFHATRANRPIADSKITTFMGYSLNLRGKDLDC